jgi:hypothetical protein
MVKVQDAENSGSAVLEVLSEEACWALLRAQSVGRIVFVDRDGQPMAFPVNYILDGTTLAFRSDPGTKLDASTMGKVAFEIDGTDTLYREGWSVLVTGVGRDITDGIDSWSERLRGNNLFPWADGAKEHWIAIASPSVSGRRIRHSVTDR